MMTPLEGIRILDWTQYQMGTVATSMLADFGAEVIHIEDRVRGDGARGMMVVRGVSMELAGGRNAYFEYVNHNKKSITIDLKKEEGKKIVYRLAQKSDAFVHNFRQGVPEKLGLGYDELTKHNPGLIYTALSGFGPFGPDAMEPSFDYLGLARSGIMNAVGEPGDPPGNVKGGIADQMGAIMAAWGVTLALFARERQGVGQKVDVSQLGSMMALQGLTFAYMNFSGKEMPKVERKSAANPLWNHYLCSDGIWLVLGMLAPDNYWPVVCKALDIEHLVDDPKFNSMAARAENCRKLIEIMDKVFITRSSAEWMTHLKATGDVICTPIQTVEDLLKDPQTWANDYFIEYNHNVLGKIIGLGLPFHLSKTPGQVKLEAPEFGQHTEEVLIEVGGYTWEEIAAFKDREVI